MKPEIPENYTEFLYWVKETTEAFWSENPETSEAEFVCEDWQYGAKWLGMTEVEIDQTERKYNIKFTPEHREFLRILHAVDRKVIYKYDEDDSEEIIESPYFYNWLQDHEEIEAYLKWPYQTIWEDVAGMNKVWLKSWGTIRPKSDEEKEKIFSAWFEKIPQLIPIHGHRFVVSDHTKTQNPVLSMYGSDIIVLGWNMRHYLLRELKDSLNLLEDVFDEEDQEWYIEDKQELLQIHKEEFAAAKTKSIPVIEEMILYWSSGWSSFGKKYPHETDSYLQPIVRAFVAEDEDGEANDQQKKFNSF
ncbi:hypothetical protein [Kordia sp.]|uniref:hypothetical protein n=1 Tax=Kordia sp. TaxID=1965332 RepID=UPI0025BA3A93|nr:hypothetical protein [Kordia sp.]MCH2195334.1 hypothetical protein [Kordia sp.]